ncbi:MAG: DUF3095 domain-containing protein [Bacteroidota bacterium]
MKIAQDTYSFYQNLPSTAVFSDVLNPATHQALPDDWWVAITDVVNSTQAIEQGKYKDVNTAGALAAMAIANASKGMDYPFVFGGDGINCLIPNRHKEMISDVLYDVSKKVLAFFDLKLRVGLVPMSELRKAGHPIFVAKHQLSAYYEQAIISGSGTGHAEKLVKDSKPHNPYLVYSKKEESIVADFTGFTCRWKDIPSSRGETVSVIIKFRAGNAAADYKSLQEVLDNIDKVFGREQDYHPVSAEQLQISQSKDYHSKEALILSGKKSGKDFQWMLWKAKLQSIITSAALKLSLPIQAGWYQLNKLKSYQILSSDYKKFDGSLKFVVNLDPKQRLKWKEFLESLYQQGRIYYGMHISDRAIMTCLLHEGSKREVHFIDGADGGYALAAKQLKEQIKR